MKIMKNFALFIAATVLGVGSLCASYAREDMVSYIRTKPPKVVAPKLMRFAKEIIGDKCFDACLSAFAIKFGHPNYEELSPKHGLAMFLFEEDREALFLAKFNKNSPAKEELIRGGLSLKDVSGWTFISANREKLDKLTETDWMLSIADVSIKNDIELCVSVPKVVVNMNIDALKREMGPNFVEQADRFSFLFCTLRDEIDELQSVYFAGNFDDSITTVSCHCKAKPGSDIGALWASKVDGDIIKLPQMVFERAPYFLLFENGNPRATIAFSDKINYKILKNCNYSDLDALWKKIMEKSKVLEHKRNGQCAAYVIPDGDAVGMVAVCGGRYDSTDIKALMDVDDAIGDLAKCAIYPGGKCESSKTRKTSQYTHRNETVCVLCDCKAPSHGHRPCQGGKNGAAAPCNCDALSHEHTCVCQGGKNGATYAPCNCALSHEHMCVCQGNLILATSQALAKKAIDNILDNKTKIALADGNRTQGSVNIRQIASDILKNRSDLSMECAPDDLKPIEIHSTSGNDKYSLFVTFDNASVREFGKLLAAYSSEEALSDEDTSSEDAEEVVKI
jgi:hypothetical protein